MSPGAVARAFCAFYEICQSRRGGVAREKGRAENEGRGRRRRDEKKARKNIRSGDGEVPRREKSRKMRKEGKAGCPDGREKMKRRGKGWDNAASRPAGLGSELKSRLSNVR